MCAAAVSVAGEHKFFSVVAKHREGIKHGIVGNLFQSGAIEVDHKQIKRHAFGNMVAAENNFFA